MNLQSFIQSAHFYTVETCPEPLMAELANNWAPIAQLAEIAVFDGIWFAWKLQGDPAGLWRTIMDRHDIAGSLHDCARALWETAEMARIVRALPHCARALWETDYRPAPPSRQATIARLWLLAYTRVRGKRGDAICLYLGQALAILSLPNPDTQLANNRLRVAIVHFRMAARQHDIMPRPRR